MRKQQLTMFVSLLLMVVVAAAAQTPSQLDRVNVVRGTDDIRVEIQANGAVAPKLSKMTSPDRVIVDLPATIMGSRQNHIDVGADGVKGVRIAMDGKTPPTTRVVVDLDQACAYELTPGPAGKLVLTLHAGESAQKASAPAAAAKTETASAPAPAGRMMSPFSPRVIDSKSIPATKPAAASKPTADNAASPNDFVFVEPSYQAKNEDAKVDASNVDAKKDEATATSEPIARASQAAERFADKTAAELLPVGEHAAMGQTSSSTGITPAVNMAAEQKAQAGQQSAVAGPKYTGEPI